MDHTKEILEAICSQSGGDLSRYSEIFSVATGETPPVFFQKEYEDFFWHCATTIPNWLPAVVVACARTESGGSSALLDIWKGVTGYREAEDGLLRHAKDEAGHARLFVKLARHIFGESYQPGELDGLESSLNLIGRSDAQKGGEAIDARMLIDYLIQLNIVEIRTRIHLHFLAPMYFHLAPDESKPKVENILRSLARDETAHVTYTARLIDDWASDGDIAWLTNLYRRRLQDYIQHTLDHCDIAKHDYGQGRFPSLFTH